MIDAENFKDVWGLVQPQPGTISDNGVRFTTERILYLDRKGFATGAHEEMAHLFNAILKCEKEPGLLERFPGCPRQDSFDNYIAAMTASRICDGGKLAGRIWKRGVRKLGWYKNGTDWGLFVRSPLLWRSPFFIAYSHFCAHDEVNKITKPILQIKVDLNAKSEDQDGKILSWFMVRELGNRIDSQQWSDMLLKQYSGGVGNVLGNYFDPVGKEHPNAQALWGVYN